MEDIATFKHYIIISNTSWMENCSKMMEAIFEIVRDAKSLELILASYRLLSELEKVFSLPHLYVVTL